MREARLTVSPTSAYESRSRLPMAPASTEPVCTPMPWLSGRARPAFHVASRARISRAARTARAA